MERGLDIICLVKVALHTLLKRLGFRMKQSGLVLLELHEAFSQIDVLLQENILFGKVYDEERYNKGTCSTFILRFYSCSHF